MIKYSFRRTDAVYYNPMDQPALSPSSPTAPEHDTDRILLTWNISPHTERERTGVFYTTLFVSMVFLLLFAIWQKDFLFGVFVILATGTVLFLSSQQAHVYTFTLTDEKIIFGDYESVYEYSHFAAFDLYEFAPDDIELFLLFREKLRPILRIRIHRADRSKIQSILIEKKIVQKKMEPSLIDVLSKMIGI